jgi:hypothetical protein
VWVRDRVAAGKRSDVVLAGYIDDYRLTSL